MSNSANKNEIKEYSIKRLLSDNSNYIVPMYQRNYAWGEGEINQLIQDVLDYQDPKKSNERYYIGTLVVFKRTDGCYEVIDGQQRFTTLSLIAMCLKNNYSSNEKIDMSWFERLNVNFESRPKSEETFTALWGCKDDKSPRGEAYNEGILNGYSLIQKALSKLKQLSANNLNDFVTYLFESVQIIRVDVPEDTDLNHYFEVMNNRGEQLEKHEILKAKMMSVLNNIEDSVDKENSINVLQKVWEGCENMERYIQYGFVPDERHALFGKNDWGKFTPLKFSDIVDCLSQTYAELPTKTENTFPISQILQKPLPNTDKTKAITEESPDRFKSVINFSNFLLHVLRVYTQDDIALDDKRLIQQFDTHLLDSKSENQTLIDNVKTFIYSLLKCKFLFDQYIIKREDYQGKDAWSLKRLKWHSKDSQSFTGSFNAKETGNQEVRDKGVNRQCLMLIAAFHVSTPTLVYKHWLNAALYYLYQQDVVKGSDYLMYLHKIAKRFVFERFLSTGEGSNYFQMTYESADCDYPKNIKSNKISADKLKYGEIENNFVFNYLDFLIWRSDRYSDSVVNQFEFTARSSVEHFYPQHPMDGFEPLKSEALHEFGNLCLISHSKNSRLSNFPPKTKIDHFEKEIQKSKIDSLKLYKMIKQIESKALTDKKDYWNEDDINQHGSEMIALLCDATNVDNE